MKAEVTVQLCCESYTHGREKEKEGEWKLFGSFAHRFNNFWISFCLRRAKQSLDVLTDRAMSPSVVLRGSH